MLDRLISGAGALTDRADRLVRALTSGRGGRDVMGNRPGSVLVIAILIVGSVVFGLLALESNGLRVLVRVGFYAIWHVLYGLIS